MEDDGESAPPASTGTRWRAERLIGHSALHGDRYRVLGTYGTEREAKDACDVDVAMGAHALHGCWYVVDTYWSPEEKRTSYYPPGLATR